MSGEWEATDWFACCWIGCCFMYSKCTQFRCKRLIFFLMMGAAGTLFNVLTPSSNDIMYRTLPSTYFQTIVRNSCLLRSVLILALAIQISGETFVHNQVLLLEFLVQTMTRNFCLLAGVQFAKVFQKQSGETLVCYPVLLS